MQLSQILAHYVVVSFTRSCKMEKTLEDKLFELNLDFIDVIASMYNIGLNRDEIKELVDAVVDKLKEVD